MNEERTTKYVTATVKLVFHGDYIDADDVTRYADGWIRSGLDDRDDLHGIDVAFGAVREISGDPEGYDS